MSANKSPPRIDFDHPDFAVLEDGREPEMLWVGLTAADTAHNKKLQIGEAKAGRRRTLDDMRRLSEQIKRVTEHRRK